MTGGVIPSEAFNEQLKKAVRESERRLRGQMPRQGRWNKKGSGGGSCECPEFFGIGLQGTPTSGAFILGITATSDAGTTTENITFQWNSTVAQAKTQLATHTKIVADDITETFGALPEIEISFGIVEARALNIAFVSSTLNGSARPNVKKLTPGSCSE